jgi:hypothetical protein
VNASLSFQSIPSCARAVSFMHLPQCIAHISRFKVMKVMAWYVISDIHKVMTTLTSVVFVLVLLVWVNQMYSFQVVTLQVLKYCSLPSQVHCSLNEHFIVFNLLCLLVLLTSVLLSLAEYSSNV